MSRNAVLLALSIALVHGCATNPATGRRQLMLISEAQEVAMGRDADTGLVQELGAYDDPELAALVERLGSQMARVAERPQLPWTFRVVDDPAVNAFALPGGFVYVTRGILAHLSSEAELAGVIGHEIGHVTARHSAAQISQVQLAQVGLGVGGILAPEDVRPFLGLAQTGMSLLFLKHGRDAEREADALGARYMSRIDYPPDALLDVFEVLGAVTEAAGGRGLPNWLSTHPSPEDRHERVRAMLAELPDSARQAPRRREAYLERIDGIVFGEDPREGFFEGSTFLHPTLRFRMEFPAGWQTRNARAQVSAINPGGDAALVLTVAREPSPRQAAQSFFERSGVEVGSVWLERVAGVPAVSQLFRAQSDAEQLHGGVAFFEFDTRVYALIGYARPAVWSRDAGLVRAAITSFARLRARRALNAQPQRLVITRLERAMSLEQLQRRSASTVSLETLALINQVPPDRRLPEGTRVKRVVGGVR